MFYYKNYILACPEIPYCLESQCTSLANNTCVKCDGEVKHNTYWAAYTRNPSNGERCESKRLIGT